MKKQHGLIKRLKWPFWSLLLIIIIAIGLNQVMKNDNKKDEHNSNKETETAEIHESIVYPGLILKTEVVDTKLYTSSISTPIAKSDAINKPIQKWINNQNDEFLKNMQENELDGWRSHLNIQVDTEKITDHMYSLIFNSFHDTAGSNGWHQVKTFNIDTDNDKILNLSDFFTVNEYMLGDINTLVKDDLKNQEDISFYVFEDSLQEVLENPDTWKWSISRKSLTLYFNQYEVAAGAAGIIKAEISLEKLSNYLKQELVNEWSIPKKEKEEDKKPNKQEEITLDPNGKYIALTFDDGPHPQVTAQILNTLKAHDIKATFFMLGAQVEYYPDLANQVAEAGHEIANHTEHHRDLTKLGKDEILKEINESREKIISATGIDPNLVRPPYGAYNDDVKQVFKDNNFSMILWSVDSLDWKSRNASAVNELVLKEVEPDSIVLMHDIHQSTADALPELLTSLEQKGYEFVTVSQLLSLDSSTGIGPYYNR